MPRTESLARGLALVCAACGARAADPSVGSATPVVPIAPATAVDASTPGATWRFDPIGDRSPDVAKFVIKDMRGVERIPFTEQGLASGFVSAIDVAYAAPVEDDPGQAHRVIWRVFADDGDWPAETPLATFEATIVPDNHVGQQGPVRWTHHELHPAPAVHGTVWLTWETPGEIHVAFADADLALAQYWTDDAVPEPGGGRHYGGRERFMGGTPFVRVTFTGVH